MPVKIKDLISKDTHSQSLRHLFILLTFCLSSDHTEQEADSSFPGSSGKSFLVTYVGNRRKKINLNTSVSLQTCCMATIKIIIFLKIP